MKVRSEILVIGIGNHFRCDDGVGLCVIEELQKDRSLRNVEFMKMEPDGYSLIEAWSNRHFVIIVDAAISGGPPGTIRRFDALAKQIPYNLSPLSTHDISLAEAIELSDTLNKLPDRLVIFAVEIGNVSYGEELTPAVVKAGEKLVDRVRGLIQEELTDGAAV